MALKKWRSFYWKWEGAVEKYCFALYRFRFKFTFLKFHVNLTVGTIRVDLFCYIFETTGSNLKYVFDKPLWKRPGEISQDKMSYPNLTSHTT